MVTFFAEVITAEHDTRPQFSKKPHCPDRIIWRNQTYTVTDHLAEWRQITPRISPARQRLGLARIFFRIRLDPAAADTVFDIYFDPVGSPGQWVLVKSIVGNESTG